MDKAKVLLIGGSSRSGSTVLGRLLGETPGGFYAGEVHSIWERNFLSNELCSCGRTFRACDFWDAVVRHAFGNWDALDLEAIRQWQLGTARMRDWPLLAVPALRPPDFAAQLAAYADVLGQLYQAIQTVANCRYIIDASKNPTYGCILNTIPAVELHVLHLARDSRAVAYSWQRRKVMPEIHWQEQYMEQFLPARTAFFWVVSNVLTEGYKYIAPDYRFLRYDDFAAQPAEVVQRIWDHLGYAGPAAAHIAGSLARISPGHSVGGNPNRFEHGEIPVRLDDEWRRKMRPRDRRLVGVLTWPWLRRYIYGRRLPAQGLVK